MGIAVADGSKCQLSRRPTGGRCQTRSIADRYNKVCFRWLAGSCNRHPCPFLHSEPDGTQLKKARQPQRGSILWRNPNADAGNKGRRNPNADAGNKWMRNPNADAGNKGRRNPNADAGNKWMRNPNADAGNKGRSAAAPPPRPQPRPQPDTRSGHQLPPASIKTVCSHFTAGEGCPLGEKCKSLHSWFVGHSFSLLATLPGHQSTVTGIALPQGSDKLYSAGHDETVRAWDCHTGQCLGDVGMGGKIGCMISEEKGRWIFAGLPNAVRACKAETSAIVNLEGPIGQVYALAVDAGQKLFAGGQDGRIMAWEFVGEAAGTCFEPAAPLAGHQRPVVSLGIGGGMLYSGSMDGTIRVWDIGTSQCLHTLSGHTDVVMSLLCWNGFLLSGSLDGTVNVWAKTESGGMEAAYSRDEEHGVLALAGMPDGHGKPVLCCACNDDSVRLYDLPSFGERGRIFAREGVRAVSSGPGGLFFTGDGAGDLRVWKWMAESAAVSS